MPAEQAAAPGKAKTKAGVPVRIAGGNVHPTHDFTRAESHTPQLAVFKGQRQRAGPKTYSFGKRLVISVTQNSQRQVSHLGVIFSV